jgi:hypothetical protein
MTINIIECYHKLYVLENLSVKIRDLFIVLNIMSPLHEHMLPIGVTITYWLHFYYFGPLIYLILYDNGSLIQI